MGVIKREKDSGGNVVWMEEDHPGRDAFLTMTRCLPTPDSSSRAIIAGSCTRTAPKEKRAKALRGPAGMRTPSRRSFGASLYQMGDSKPEEKCAKAIQNGQGDQKMNPGLERAVPEENDKTLQSPPAPAR